MPEDELIERRVPLHVKILIGLAIGVALGIVANRLGSVSAAPIDAARDADRNQIDDRLDWLVVHITDPIGRVFLRLVLMVVIPLVFSALSLGVYEIGDVRRLGRVGLRTLIVTAGFSITAVVIGVTLVNVIKPGAGLTVEQREMLNQQYAGNAAATVEKAQKAKPLSRTILDIIPENPLQEMVGSLDGTSPGNGMLSVMFFSLVFGIALAFAGQKGATVVAWLEGIFAIAMIIIAFAMRLAPMGVAFLVFSITARMGADILQTLFWFVLTAILGLGFHLVVVYSLAVRLFGGMKPSEFFSSISEAMLTAFGTSSSNATLPTAMRVAEENLRLPRRISNFVLTVGATGNQNGTALYEGVVVLFLAQVFGIQLTLAQQVTVVLMSILAGIGTAGVPGGSLPLIVIVLRSVGVPGEGIGLILGVDRILDMCRTVLNVTGDLAVATCVAHWEGAEEEPAQIPESEP